MNAKSLTRLAPLWLALLLITPQLARSQTSTITRVSSFEYDPASGQLIREVIEPDRPNDCLSTTYGHDAWGNRTSSSTSACAGASGDAVASASTARTGSSSFEAHTVTIGTRLTLVVPAGQFATRITNALGQTETRTYDPRTGAVLSLTGPNGLTTRWEYDGFGRKTRETRADGTSTGWLYQYCSTVLPASAGGVTCPSLNGGNSAAFVFTQSEYAANSTKMAADKISYVDALGRVLRVQTTDFSGNTVVQDNTYNALGQLVRSTQPYVPGQTQYATTTTYDALGRVLTQSSPDAQAPGGVATVSYAYNGLSVTVTNPKGQTKTTVKNVQGQTALVADHDGNQVLYSYDPLGQLIRTNAAGQITTLSYDQRGRKIGMNDPAMGVWSYGYNAFGELVRQTDSLGQVSTMGYDALGRMTTKNEPDLKSTWFFDRDASGQACGKSVGKLCEARADNGYRRIHGYDSLGRANSTRTAQDSSQALSSVSVGFDANTGRMNSQTWPTGYTASYGYSTLGYLQTVNGSGSGMPATQLDKLQYDSQGRLTSYRQGGRITTVKGYDAATGRLTQIQAQVDGQAAGSVFQQSYKYDALSNLTARNDANTGVQESFGYDSLNRLRTYTSLGGSVSPPSTTQVVYDARGNIIYKSDVGRYWYDSQRPNRLANITLEGYAGAQALTGTRALSYVFDDYGSTAKSNGSVPMGNGNLMYTVSHDNASGKHTVRWESYTSFNMPLEIKYGNIGAAQAGTTNGATVDATATYSCPSGQVVSGSMCTQTQTAEVSYATSCRRFGLSNRCTVTAVCPSGFSLSGSTCQRLVNTQAASRSYGCPSGYSLSDTTCRAQSNSATTATSDRTLSFVYGPEHQRVKQVVTLSGNAPSQMMGGTTWYLHGDNNSLLYEREVKANGVTEQRHFLQAAGMTFALVVTRTGSGISSSNADRKMRPTQVEYFQQDHLGSIAAIADENGTVIERLAYDPWGKRRYPNGLPDSADSIVGVNTDRGYTLHEHLDEVGVIHMNGRVYDPLIGRFMSADPFIQAPGNLQSYNRYAYVMNNPLAYTDPSGYISFKQLVRIAVVVAVAYYTGGYVKPWALLNGYSSFAAGAMAGAAGGAAAGFTGSALSGANLNQSLQAGAQGALTGALFGAAGGVGGSGTEGANSLARYAAHAGAGCVSSVAGGGNCGQGAASAVFGKFTSNAVAGMGGSGPSAMIARGVATAVAGGVGSIVAGGKFENGATTAAFGYLFNELQHGFTKEQAGYEVRIASLSYGEAVDHWANGGGIDVRVPLSSLDLSSVRTADFSGVGDQRAFNLSGNFGTRLSDQLVYGNITLKLVAPGVVEAGYDRYNFDTKPLTTANVKEILPRNVATSIGGAVNSFASTVRNPGAGPGTPFFIQLDGKARIR